MNFRPLVISIAFAFCGQSYAQELAAPPSPDLGAAAPDASNTFTQSPVGAARDTLQVMFIQSVGVIEAFRMATPVLLGQIARWPFYESLSPQKQQALADYADAFPPIAQAEATLAAPELVDRFAPQIAAIFSESELHDIRTFMDTAEAQSYILHAMLAGVRGEPASALEASEAELAAWSRFAETPGGAAMNQRIDQLSRLMRDFGYASSSHPRVSGRLRRDLCNILAEQCPTDWRAT